MASVTIGTGSGGWGPATTGAVLYFVASAVGGLAAYINGDLSYLGYMEEMRNSAAVLAVVGVGRGIAYGGVGTGFGKKEGVK